MIRRRLFAYTVMYTAGISAGFFIYERSRLACGTLFMLASAMSGLLMTGFCSACRSARPDNGIRLAAALAAGFLVFTCRFISYGTAVDDSMIGEITSIEGTVKSVTAENGKVRLVISDTDALRGLVSVLVTVRDTGDIVPAETAGSRIHAYGSLSVPLSADNPGCFDYRMYLRSRGIGYVFQADSIVMTGKRSGRYLKFLYRTRDGFLAYFSDPEIRGFIKGTVFGDKSEISEDIRDDFNENGTGHILAVSGLHTGFLYALMRFITGRRKTLMSTLVTAAVLILYGDMTMWSPSAMRAVTVVIVSMMSVYARRPFDLLTSVSAAALLILSAEPYQLFSTGFQMSFLALAGIAFLAKPLSYFTGETLAVMIAVQAAVLPVTGYYFHRINALSLFINVPVIFLASLLVPLCMGALFLCTVTGALPGSVISVTEGLTEMITRLNSLIAGDGALSGQVVSAGAGLLMLFYLVILMISSEWCRVMLLRKEYGQIIAAVFCIAAVSACAGAASFNQFADDEVVFVSVGQGDCTHIRAGSKDILIDGGGSTEHNTGEDTLMPYMLSNGAERAEIALVTHLHTDHYLGIAELAQIYPVGAVGIPSDYRKSVEDMLNDSGDNSDENAIVLPDNITFIEPESRIMITDDVYIDTIWPPERDRGSLEVDDPNEHNMVYMINYRGIRIMVTGDLLEEDELRMVEYYQGTDILDCDVLKVAHHGSKSSSSEAFLDAASPEIAVIQVGLHNFYGHPHRQTLDRLKERGIKVFRTDISGAVGIDIHGSRLSIDLFRQQ